MLTSKSFLFFAAFIFVSINTFGQQNELDPSSKKLETPSDRSIYSFVDVPAQFPGGVEAMQKYLATSIVYPKEAIEMGLEGRCYLTFVVTDKGEITNIRVRKGVTDCPECDQEAIRVVKAMPNWIPGVLNGKNVNSYFALPISYKLVTNKRKKR